MQISTNSFSINEKVMTQSQENEYNEVFKSKPTQLCLDIFRDESL